MDPYILATRQAIESQYDAICNIIEYQPKIINKITNFVEVTVNEKQPCKISFEEVYVNNQTDNESKVTAKIKLFIAPELEIKPGSKIVATKRGKTTIYQSSGEAAVYDTHQEIMLQLFKGWA